MRYTIRKYTDKFHYNKLNHKAKHGGGGRWPPLPKWLASACRPAPTLLAHVLQITLFIIVYFIIVVFHYIVFYYSVFYYSACYYSVFYYSVFKL